MPLIKTKLTAPQRRGSLVTRPQLLEQLEESELRAFTLLCAPAGYGKTTLLTEWIAGLRTNPKHGNPSVCWLSLEKEDNDPTRFLSYLVAALESGDAGICGEARTMLQASSPAPTQTILASVINDLEGQARPMLLVLDDYQFITTAAIHEAIGFILDHQPQGLHVVIATRSDPPLSLARLRTRGQMVEIRAEDLRFSYDEAVLFYNQVMGLGLTLEEMRRLEERTEGWVAGLQMAGLALQGIIQSQRSGAAQFIQKFSGSHRYILDYLVEEVLSQQPPGILDFLLQTSILENLSGPLCDAVIRIGPRKSGSEPGSSQQILEYLERSNLFLVALDSDRQWYRYHHLFADLLRARLEQRALQDMSELHGRAAEWYEHNQRFPEAVNHSLDARDYPGACRLIEAILMQPMLAQYALSMLMNWIERLPLEIVSNRPWLRIAQAWSSLFTNDLEKIEPLVKAAEQAIPPDVPVDLQNGWKGNIACIRAYVADVHSDVPATIKMYQQALDWLPQEDAAPRTFARYMLGRAFFICGDLSQAIDTLTENVRECIEYKVNNNIAPTLSTLAKVYRIEGRLHDSMSVLQKGQAYIEACDPRRVSVAGLVYNGQAAVLREWNDLVGAEELVRRSLELCKPWASPGPICTCYMLLAQIHQDQGDLSKAEQTLHLAEVSIRGQNPLVEVIYDLNTARVGFWLATDQLARASQWAHEREKNIHPEDKFSVLKEQDEITLARVEVAERNFNHAFQTLARLAMVAGEGGRIRHLIEIRKLQALALREMGKQEQALTLLQKCLTLAEPEGYIRTLVGEGKPMREMLRSLMRVTQSDQSTYIRKLLAALSAPESIVLSGPQSPSLVEPLTAREIEVLQAMAEGLSNHLIAEKLILAEGTVKFYVHAVLEKLGVHNRTRAVIEAKKHKII